MANSVEHHSINTRRIFLVEGPADKELIERLIKNRELLEADVFSAVDVGGTGGISRWEETFLGIRGVRGYNKDLLVGIIGDCDNDPAKSFDALKLAIEASNRDEEDKWPVPAGVGEFARGTPTVAIYLLPSSNERGAYETVLYKILKRRFAEKIRCIEQAHICMEFTSRTRAKLDKARVHAFIALHNKKNPGLSIRRIWEERQDMFKLDDGEFDGLAEFLGRAI